jgi:hypothetical protein
VSPEAFYVGDGLDEAVSPSAAECIDTLRGWFEERLWAEAQGLSEDGVEDALPGFLGRLRAAVASVRPPPEQSGLGELEAYALALGAAAERACVTDEEREAIGAPIQFTVRRADPLDVPRTRS